jgi:hypothetical protein
MNRLHTAAFAALTLLAAGAASAQPLTAVGEDYPAPQIAARDAAQAGHAATRAEVRAELDAARRAGSLVEGDTGLKQRELFPARYAHVSAEAGKSAEQARADRLDARGTPRIAGSFGAAYVN